MIGAVVGGLSGFAGALGGKLLASVGGKALKLVGGLFGRGGAEAADGAASSVVESGAESVTADAADSAASSGAKNAAEDAGGARSGEPTAEEPSAGGKQESGCGGAPHSFVGATPVLMADGTSQPIDHIKAGDQIENSVPDQPGTHTHTVDRVIVTTTDHDFADITITTDAATPQPAGPPSNLRRTLTKTGLVLAGAAAVAATTGTATLTTTYHHPFYDHTQTAFIEAQHLHPGDQLQTPTGTTEVIAVHLYHATETTYDLTINSLHTYYVIAGNMPVLVHNCDDALTARKIHDAHPDQYLRDRVINVDVMTTAEGRFAAQAGSEFAEEQLAVMAEHGIQPRPFVGRGVHSESQLLEFARDGDLFQPGDLTKQSLGSSRAFCGPNGRIALTCCDKPEPLLLMTSSRSGTS